MDLEKYYSWLMRFIDNQQYDFFEYSELLENLFYTPFLWSISNDANRAGDGLTLRAAYIGETGDNNPEYHLGGHCSILEMMIALAHRCEQDIMGSPFDEDRTWYWFWEMIRSLGFEDCTDSVFDIDYFESVVEKFAANLYERDGRGGLFKVFSRSIDMRNMEIWYQMCAYLNENYTFDV